MKFILGIIRKLIGWHAIPVKLYGVRRVLVVDLNYIGDMLFSSPVYRALKKNLPGVEVETLIYPFTEEVLSANPFVDRIHTVPKASILRQLNMLLRLRRIKFDLVLQLNTSLRTNFLMWIIGGKLRLGYDYRNRGCFNNIRVPIATRTARTRYRIDECVDLLEDAFGWKITERDMILRVSDEHKALASEILDRHGVKPSDTVIGVQANCRDTWKERRWEQSKFAALASELIRKNDAKIIFTGSKDDVDYVNVIIQGIEMSHNVVNLVGKTSLMELAALMQRIDVFVTVNTGPMQIAVSQKTPTVVLMGVTPPVITYPMSVPTFQYVWLGDSEKLNRLDVDPKDSTRMRSIEVSHVLEKVDYLLALRKKGV